MTKLRAPLSIEQALARIAGQLPDGYASMSQITHRSASLVRKWGDPDRDEEIPMKEAIALDLAYQAHGGTGHPLYDAYSIKLDLAQQGVFAERFELLRKASVLMKEGGEAHAAVARACLPDSTERHREEALRELAENFEAIKPLLAMLGGSQPSISEAADQAESPEPRERDPP